MSTDFSIRPVGTPAPSPVVQPQTLAASNAVPTELPAGKSVTAADGGASMRSDQQNPNIMQFTYQAVYDLDALSMVYLVVNRNTNEVVEQYPDEAVLRRRAYLNELEKKGPRSPVIPTDVMA